MGYEEDLRSKAGRIVERWFIDIGIDPTGISEKEWEVEIQAEMMDIEKRSMMRRGDGWV